MPQAPTPSPGSSPGSSPGTTPDSSAGNTPAPEPRTSGGQVSSRDRAAQQAATPEGPGKEPPTPVAPTASPEDAALKPGTRIAVVQQVPRQGRTFHVRTEGVVVKHEQSKTGSWYAHAKDDKLWLDRLTLRKDDGELVVFILDALTHVEVVGEGPDAS